MTENLVVSTSCGPVRGRIQKDYHGGTFFSFSGIPYAKAPVGELRFKAPQPAEPWQGTWDGTKEGWESPSVLIPTTFPIGKEDNCLHVNVYTKNISSSNNVKPVMVYFHGGSYFYGSNRSYLYGPDNLMIEDIVLVVVNFRLGILGFLSLNDPSLDIPGNAGLKDQVLALKWVQKNINNFGGDPNNVTIFGESAGSSSVHLLVLSPLTKGLFHKAIMQSGSALNPWAMGRRNAKDIAKLMGYNTDMDEKTFLEKFRKASTSSILKAQFKIVDPFFASVIRPFGPVIEYPHDGAFLTEDPEEIMKSGKFNQIPMIIGYNSNEGLLFETLRKFRSDVYLPKNLERDIPFSLNIPEKSDKAKEMAQKMEKYYYKGEGISEDNIQIRYTLFGDIIFVQGIQKTIRLFKKHSSAPIYVYKMTLTSSLNFLKEFTQATFQNVLVAFTSVNYWLRILPFNPFHKMFLSIRNNLPKKALEGAAHGDDIFYLFTSMLAYDTEKGTKEDYYIHRFVSLWTNFAKYGDPIPKTSDFFNNVKWNQVSDENIDNILEIGTELRETKNVDKERILFLEKLYEEYAS